MDASQLLKGVLDLAVLATVGERDDYGYEIVRRLRIEGFSGMGEASVYGTLRRLHRQQLLTSYMVPSEEGPARKYYSITVSGRAQLSTDTASWTAFVDAMKNILNLNVPPTSNSFSHTDTETSNPTTQNTNTVFATDRRGGHD